MVGSKFVKAEASKLRPAFRMNASVTFTGVYKPRHQQINENRRDGLAIQVALENFVVKSRKIMILGLLMIVVSGLWFAVGPRVMADVSQMQYSEPLFDYWVEYDEVYNLETEEFDRDRLLVAIQPEYRTENGSAFSEAYIQAAQAQAALWSQTRLPGEMLDVMVVFNTPQTLAEANEILHTADAVVFESGAVGYGADGIPFAVYAKEDGPLLTQTLAEIGEANRGFEAEVVEGETAVSSQPPADIRGYLAVRVWVDAAGLAILNSQPAVDFVDTTPQTVRDLLATNLHWKNTSINHVSIEMPVWAYDWK